MSDRKRDIPRRQFIAALAAGAGAGLAGCSGAEPPTYGNILRMGDWLTYKTHRLLLPADSMASIARRYFDPSHHDTAGEHTMMVRRAFQQAVRKRSHY